jgi:hypothetical protein
MSIFNPHPRRVSRGLSFAVLAAALAVTAVALSQCRQVGGSLTGADVTVLNPTLNAISDCVHQCNDRFNAAHSAEVRRHEAALQGCAGDGECNRAENRLHHDLQLAIVRGMQACKRACHDTGPGAAGN